jgi:hypothetical protein
MKVRRVTLSVPAVLLLLLWLLPLWPQVPTVADGTTELSSRPRLLVLTDIGGDPDDTQSLIRLMVFANEFEIEGLIASASGTPGELKRDLVKPQLIREVVEAYGKVRPNLAVHAPGYPETARLLNMIKSGEPRRGVSNLGEGRDTEGSRWIIAAADREDSRPLNVAIWGGAHDLAQALWRVRNDRSPEEVERWVSRLRVHSIGHQDDTGPWIVENFPGLFFILSSADEGDVLGRQQGKVDRRQSVYRGMYLGGDESLTSREWIDAHVRVDHGPLGALYPVKTWTAPNPHGTLKEGDTPSWFYFLRNGLSDPEHPEWGGWGGRFHLARGRLYRDAQDRVGDMGDARATVWRWRSAFQNHFAARMDWCVQPRKEGANHAPVAVLNGDRSAQVIQVSTRPGGQVRLSARGSSDPDRDGLVLRWFHYPEPGGNTEPLELRGASNPEVTFRIPESAGASETYHIVLEVQDRGEPPLVSYRRAVVNTTLLPRPRKQ